MILWLPLQGFAAVAMPFRKHGFHASAPHIRATRRRGAFSEPHAEHLGF
jgi:hypothetical protein